MPAGRDEQRRERDAAVSAVRRERQSLTGFCLRSENHESKPGEWTERELVCFEGKIQLLSEAAEVFYTDIKIQPIDALPREYEHLFK